MNNGNFPVSLETPHAPRFKAQDGEITPDTGGTDDLQSFYQAAMLITGTHNRELAITLLNQVAMSQGELTASSLPKINGALAAVAEFAPRDVTEALLVSQMVASHNLSMKFISRAAKVSSVDLQKSYLNSASKLSRLFVSQVDTLRRYRQKGCQKMTVEHVHVHEGGQAIVGSVTQEKGGGAGE